MTTIRALLDEASSDQPASSITRETAILAGRRARRRRSLAVACAAAAVAMAAVAAVAVSPTVRPPDRHVDAATESPQQVAARLTATLRGTMARVRPDAKVEPDPNHRPGRNPDALEVVPPDPALDQLWYEGHAIVIDSQGHGTVTLRVAPDAAAAGFGSAPCEPYTTKSSSCAPRTGPHGEHLSVWTSMKQDHSVESAVTVFRPDGSAVNVGTTNFTDEPNGPGPSRSTPALTTEQLIEVATDPGLALNP
jgi:hypothetical protein